MFQLEILLEVWLTSGTGWESKSPRPSTTLATGRMVPPDECHSRPPCRSSRKQRSGLLVTISSTAGIAGQMFCTAYAAAKFGIEGWMESLSPGIAPSLESARCWVEPGFFRHRAAHQRLDHLRPQAGTIDDYAEQTKEMVQTFDTKAKTLLAQANAHHELSTSLAYE